MLAFIAKAWRFFLETSENIRHIRVLEPWYWFVVLNLLLSLITSQYDYQFLPIGFLIQLALAAWFSISVGWIVQDCPHKMMILHESSFSKGRAVKFCYRCGTRLPREFHAPKVEDRSWPVLFFQLPPHLLEYAVFWVAQSTLALVSLFLVLRFLKKPDFQHRAVLAAVILAVLAPPLVYSLGRFRRYLAKTQGMIWWSDFKNSFVAWGVAIGVVWCLLHFLLQ